MNDDRSYDEIGGSEDEPAVVSLSGGETETPPCDAADEMPEQAPQAPQLEAPADMSALAMSELNAQVAQLHERLELLPRQIRQLAAKVEDVTESISHPRVRDLLNSLLLLHDLIEQMNRSAEAGSDSSRNYQVLRDQVAQVLRVNGIHAIAESERFDPALHKAVEVVACSAPHEDGEVACCYRTGFRTERNVLRYAEVVVKRYAADATHEEDET